MDWIRGDLLWIRPSRECTGLIFVIRRRVGNAVKRNRLKRRLRRIASSSLLPVADVVVLARSAAAGSDFQSLSMEFARLASRLAVRLAR
jgi:ribonuclease P protein component